MICILVSLLSVWLYRIKTKANGIVDRFKTQPLAKGFIHEYRIDYQRTFALIACIIFVRSLLAVVAIKCQSLFQMNVKNALLIGNII